LTFRDYSEEQVAAAKSVLLELARLLGEYRDDMVVVGGWVPELLLPSHPKRHVGSIDVDLALVVSRAQVPPRVDGYPVAHSVQQANFRHSLSGCTGQGCQVLLQKNLTYQAPKSHTSPMGTRTKSVNPRQIAALVRQRIEHGGERLWRFEDFRTLPFTAVAQALSRLTRLGMLERLSKGVYYRTRETTFGKSRPNPAAIQKLASERKTLFPSGIAAANLLGFTTQTASRGEVATSALSLPRKLVGAETVIHARRPEAWASLTEADAALLDFLRRGGRTSELSPEETIRKTLALLSEKGRFERLLKVADSEPPRVRAMLGAIGEQLQKNPAVLRRLRVSLNPLSQFDFGMLARLPYAQTWQAKGARLT